MNIDEMSDQEKSVMLARLCDFDFSEPIKLDKNWPESFTFYLQTKSKVPDLYNPENMALARNILIWATKSGLLSQSQHEQLAFTFTYGTNGQRDALDMVLQWTVEAGMVEANK